MATLTTEQIRYHNEMKRVWGKDQKMVDYCLKNHTPYVTRSGVLFAIDKPTTKKDFCFGHGYCGVTTQQEINDAYNLADDARNNVEAFIDRNMDGLNSMIENLKDDTHRKFWRVQCRNGSDLQTFEVENHWNPMRPEWTHELTADECDDVIAALETEKEKFAKRLSTYLKRYGLTKINVWTYIHD